MRKQASSDGSEWQKVFGITEKKGLGWSVQSVEAGRCGALLWTCVLGAAGGQSGPRSRGGKRAETGSSLGNGPGARLDWAPVRAQWLVAAGWPLPFVPL